MINEKNLSNKLSAFSKIFAKYEDMIDSETKEIKSRYGIYEPQELLTHLQSMVESERVLKIGIIGRVKAGKSSLINALLFNGENILPKAATPMTAALTTINYGNDFSVNIEFYSKKDIDKIKQKNEQYNREINAIIENKKIKIEQDHKEKYGKLSGIHPLNYDEKKLINQAQREIDNQEPSFRAAHELYRDITASKITLSELEDGKTLKADSIQELRENLSDYVGSKGQYTPFTKVLHINLSMEPLMDIQVIDTPGLNDAVASRERRTYDMLKECNVVFIVSNAGQFLNAQDIDLASRLTKREGIQEIFVVASQIDLLLYADMHKKHNGDLVNILKDLKTILANQASKTLKAQNNAVLYSIADEQFSRLLLTSGIAKTLLSQPESEWDDNATHAYKLLKNKYSNYFSCQKNKEYYLKLISGCDALLDSINTVRKQKSEIIESQSRNILTTQYQSLNDCIKELSMHFKLQKDKIRNTDLDKAKNELDHIKKIKSNAIEEANTNFIDFVEKLEIKIRQEILNKIKDKKHEAEKKHDESIATEIEKYRIQKEGLLNWIAGCLWGGGHEDATRTIRTLQTSRIRGELIEMRNLIQDDLEIECKNIFIYWRNELGKKLSTSIRESDGEDYIDSKKLMSVCRLAVEEIGEFPNPNVPELPEDLSIGRKLVNSEIDDYLESMHDYIQLIENEGRRYAKTISESVNAIKKFNIGERIIEDIQNDIIRLQYNISRREISMDKLDRLIREIEDIVYE